MENTVIEQTNKVILVINGNEQLFDFVQLNVDMESTERQILDSVQGIIQENLRDTANEYAFSVRKVLANSSILVFPKPAAG